MYPTSDHITTLNKLLPQLSSPSLHTYQVTSHSIVNLLIATDYPFSTISSWNAWDRQMYLAMIMQTSMSFTDGAIGSCAMCNDDDLCGTFDADPLKVKVCDVCLNAIPRVAFSIKPITTELADSTLSESQETSTYKYTMKATNPDVMFTVYHITDDSLRVYMLITYALDTLSVLRTQKRPYCVICIVRPTAPICKYCVDCQKMVESIYASEYLATYLHMVHLTILHGCPSDITNYIAQFIIDIVM